MKTQTFTEKYAPALTAVLWMALYNRSGPEGFLASLLAAGYTFLTGCLIFFLRIWLPVVWAQGLWVFTAVAVCQAAWTKAHLPPWWMLSALGLALPAVDNFRAEGMMKNFSAQCGLFFAAANIFFLLRKALEHSSFGLIGEHASGIFLVLGLLVFLMQIRTPSADRGGA